MILIALGANLPSRYGSPEETLAHAISALDSGVEGITVCDQSSVWLTAPVPISDQPWYRNAVIRVETDKAIPELIACLHGIEAEFGRVRTLRNAPRVLDLDLISYNDEIYEQNGLSVPHPRMHGRAFVLRPLQEIAPDWVHPVLKQSVSDLIERLPADQTIEKAA